MGKRNSNKNDNIKRENPEEQINPDVNDDGVVNNLDVDNIEISNENSKKKEEMLDIAFKKAFLKSNHFLSIETDGSSKYVNYNDLYFQEWHCLFY